MEATKTWPVLGMKKVAPKSSSTQVCIPEYWILSPFMKCYYKTALMIFEDLMYTLAISINNISTSLTQQCHHLLHRVMNVHVQYITGSCKTLLVNKFPHIISILFVVHK